MVTTAVDSKNKRKKQNQKDDLLLDAKETKEFTKELVVSKKPRELREKQIEDF